MSNFGQSNLGQSNHGGQSTLGGQGNYGGLGGQGNFGGQPTTSKVGDHIAANTGGVQYEEDNLSSLSGGARPTTGQGLSNPVNGAGATPNLNSGASNVGSARPNVTDVGLSSGGQSLTDQIKAVNNPSQQASGLGSQTQAGVRAGHAGSTAQPPTGSAYDQAARGAQVVADKAQELSQPIQPYIQKVQETVGPYVQTAVDSAAPYVQQAREAASPYVEKASALANQGIQATAAELDKRGVNADSIQQKTADVTQSLKDYGAVGQARAGQYLQDAVEQAKTITADRENKNILATIFGTVALIWLAFGLSITALLALGIAGGLAAVLSRYSRAAVGTRAQPTATSSRTGGQSVPGVETHYPRPSHPDNSLNN